LFLASFSKAVCSILKTQSVENASAGIRKQDSVFNEKDEGETDRHRLVDQDVGEGWAIHE